MKRVYLSVFLLLGLSACGSQPVQNANPYNSELSYPDETEHFVAEKRHIFEDPLLGVMVKWLDKAYDSDVITLYVYPIPKTAWDNVEEVLSQEMDNVVAEVDHAIEQQRYQSRGAEVREPMMFDYDGQGYAGLKSSFTLERADGIRLLSNAYLFVAEDKFIKFRTSFDARITPDWNGDNVVKELLPLLQVPPESGYMKALREQQRMVEEQQMQSLMKLLMEAVEKGDLKPSSKNTDNAAEPQ